MFPQFQLYYTLVPAFKKQLSHRIQVLESPPPLVTFIHLEIQLSFLLRESIINGLVAFQMKITLNTQLNVFSVMIRETYNQKQSAQSCIIIIMYNTTLYKNIVTISITLFYFTTYLFFTIIFTCAYKLHKYSYLKVTVKL